MRRSGVLLPISALPSRYGIGCFSQEAYTFVDQLKEAGQTFWQILPIGPTGYGDSPYQSFSTFAGNPYFIDLENLIENGYLQREECESADLCGDGEQIDYGKLYRNRFPLLRLACKRAEETGMFQSQEYLTFVDGEKDWLLDYALFMALKDHYDGKSWDLWEEEIRSRDPEELQRQRELRKEDVRLYCFLQYMFYRQWHALKTYANQRNIRIIGDIPIYVAADSADAWASPDLFQLDEQRKPIAVAGCPPDGFSPDGQLWGNPLYCWEKHEKEGFSWWIRRIRHCFRLFDVVRIDHFRGFESYYSIPYKDKTAVGGHWEKGPGMNLFRAVRSALGDLPIIAEDLGFLTDDVRELLRESGYPGMKVLQFAFHAWEESDYLPHRYVRNCVVYTGTHDNDTTRGWYQSMSEMDREMAESYLNNRTSPEEEISWDYIALAMRSVADTCVIPMQDILGLGSEARINTPSTLGNNWVWRMKKNAFTAEKTGRLYRLTRACGRLG